MKIAFNPSTVAALTTPPNNKDITFDLRGRNIFARGVKFYGTDTNTWRDIKINNVSIGSNILDLRNGSNTTLTNTNGVVTINSTWRPVVDNLTSDSTTSSLSAKQGKVLKALIDGKSNSDHNHDGRYVRYYAVTTLDCNNLAAGLTAARISATNAAHTNHSAYLYISDVGTPFQIQIPDSSIPYIYKRYYGSGGWSGWFKLNAGYADSAGSVAWANITGKPSSYTPSAHTHAWISITDKIVAGNEFNIVNSGFNEELWFNYLPINNRNSTATVRSYHFGNGAKGLALVLASGFVKAGSSSSYVLLGDGGHKLESSLNVANADTVDGEHASSFSYTHLSSFNFNTIKNGRIVTFDESNTDYGWINGFASTHNNYLTSVLFNTHRTSNWYVGYILGDMSTGKTNGLLAVHKLAFVDLIPTSLKNPYALTISLNGTSQGPYDGSAAKNINITPGSIGAATSNHNHDGRYVYNYGGIQMDGASVNKNALGMTTNSGITGDWWHILQAAWNGEYRWNSLIAFPTLNRNGMYYRSGLDDNTKWGSWVKLLDTNNYSSTLDSRYYTESEVNSLLDAKLNRQNLSYGTWNPRGWNLAADYHYNGGDISISENNGKMYISVDGCFWLNEGLYRVLDTSDIGDIRGSITILLYLSNSDANWYPLIWGGDDHRNTYTSTGGVYKSHDVLSWLTSTLTLYATNIQTNNIENLSIGGGIYWNPYVESASDGSDVASITLVRSGVAGGTTLVLSLMNDTNDTILFKTNTAARLYHNSYPILTTLNTYVNNNKGYINGTEITLVNNATTLDGAHLIRYGNGTGIKQVYYFHIQGSNTSYIKLGTLNTVAVTGTGSSKVMFTVKGGINYGGTNESVYEVAASTRGSIQVTSTLVRGNRELKFGYVSTSSNVEIWMAYDGTYRGVTEVEVSSSVSFTLTMTETTTKPSSFVEGSYRVLASTADNVASATKLQTPRSIWGQSFDGTRDVRGTLSGVANILFSADGAYDIGSNSAASRYIYTHWLGAKSGLKLELGANNSGYGKGLCIDTNLNVGIGTNTPAYKLHVNGAGHFTDYVNIPTLRIYGTSDNMSWNRGPGRIIFAENTSDDLALSLVYTSYDSVRSPAGIKLTGSLGNEWFEVPRIIKTGSSDSYVLLGGGGHKLESALSVANANTVGGYHYNDFTYKKYIGYNRNGPYNMKVFSKDISSLTWGASYLIFDIFSSGYNNNRVYFGKYEVSLGHWNNTDKNPTVYSRWIFKTNSAYDCVHVIKDLSNYTVDVYIENNLWDCSMVLSIIAIDGFNMVSSNSWVNLPSASDTVLLIDTTYLSFMGNADMLDGYHENSFLRYRGATYTDLEATLWSLIGIKLYNNALPDNLTGVYNYGSVISLPGYNSRFEIYASHLSSSGNGLYYRSGWGSDKRTWLKFIDSSNIGSQSVNYANSAGHANSAGNADTVDVYHANSFLIDRGGNYTGLLYDLPCKSIFSGNNLSDSPTTGWVSGIVLGSNWNSSHYQHYLVEVGSRWYATRSSLSGKMTNWNTFAYLTDIPTVTNYYWANVKISASSSTTTSPTVSNLTATSSIRMGNILLENTDEINNSANGNIYLNYRHSGNVSLCQGGGNVGIGAMSPAYKLDVNGLVKASGFHHASHNDDSYVLLAGGGTSHIKHGSTYWSTAILFGNYVWLMLLIGEASNGISVVPTNISNPTKDIYVMNALLGNYNNSRHGRYRVAPNGVLYYVDGVAGLLIYTTICYVVNS